MLIYYTHIVMAKYYFFRHIESKQGGSVSKEQRVRFVSCQGYQELFFTRAGISKIFRINRKHFKS
jgi:hypothetical protein